MSARDTGPQRVICYPFLGRTLGGSHVASLALAARLPDAYRPLIVVHERGPLTEHLERNRINYRFLPLPALSGSQRTRLPLLLNIAQSAPRLVRFLRSNRVAIVHGNEGRMNVTWGPAAQLSGAGLVWHQHSRYVRSAFADLFLRLADRVIGVSTYALGGLPAILQERTTVIANPFDVNAAVPDRGLSRLRLINTLGLPADALIVGFFGNLTEQKRPELFADVVERIRAVLPSAVGIVCGELREPAATRMRLRPHVRLMGFQYPPEPIMAGCDLLLAPAVGEGFGRTLVEAMLTGTPVVAARSGGHCEIVRDGITGLLAAPDDCSALTSAALEVLATPDLARRLAVEGRAWAAETYSTTNHVSAVARIYDAVLAGA